MKYLPTLDLLLPVLSWGLTEYFSPPLPAAFHCKWDSQIHSLLSHHLYSQLPVRMQKQSNFCTICLCFENVSQCVVLKGQTLYMRWYMCPVLLYLCGIYDCSITGCACCSGIERILKCDRFPSSICKVLILITQKSWKSELNNSSSKYINYIIYI